MDYASIYFGKPLTQLTYEDIETFFTTEREETDQIEFKSYHAGQGFERMLSSVISGIGSFLNSSGGILIWGAPEGIPPPRESGRKEKVFTGPLCPLDRVVEKDWLISRVSDKIVPLPSGIRVQIIERSGQRVCVFEVDESPTSPHQHEGKYYMRIDGQTKPAPHHYVEALFKKLRFPQIEGYILPKSKHSSYDTHTINIEFWFMNFSPFENEENFSYRISVTGGSFASAWIHGQPNTLKPGYGDGGSTYSNEKNSFILSHGEDAYEQMILSFNNDDLAKVNSTASIYVSFGGKKSPLRTSRYRIDFGNVNNVKQNEAASMFEIIWENKLWADLNSESGRTKEHIIKSKGFLQ